MDHQRFIIAAVLCSCLSFVQGVNKTVVAQLYEAPVYSPGYEFNLNYAPNTTYDYYISTSYPNHTVSLTVAHCEMESDKNGDCLYEQLRIYDGYNSSASLIAEFCCATSPYPTWISTTNEMYMIFTSDGTNQYLGFNITCVSYGPTTTTSTTSTTTTTTATTTTTITTTAATTTASGTTASQAPSSGGSTSDGGSNSNIYIIIGCVVGGLLLIILAILAICYFLKKSKRPTTPASDHKRILWSRQTTSVKPFEATADPPGAVTQTNIFDMAIPDGRANRLPPLSSQLSNPSPVVIVPDEEKIKV